MSSFSPINQIKNNVCSLFKDESLITCSQVIQHPATVPSIALSALALTGLALYGLKKCCDSKKFKATEIAKKNIEIAKQKELELSIQKNIENAKKIAQELIQFNKEKLFKACEQVKQLESTNENTLNNLFIHDFSIPLKFPEGAAELGYAPNQPKSSNQKDVKPAFDSKTKEKVSEVRAQIKSALESQGAIPLPNLLLSGVAGIGKTMLIADLCKTTGAGFIKIPAGTLDEIEALNKIIAVAETSEVPVYIILDDGDCLFDKSAIQQEVIVEEGIPLEWENEADRINSNDLIAKRRSALIQAIICLAEKSDRKISFALTTNRPGVVVDQFKKASIAIDIQSPKKPERIKILEQSLIRVFREKKNVLGYFSSDRMSKLGDKTEGFTGRNLVKMTEVLYSSVKDDPTLISDEHIDKAIKTTEPSVEALRNKKL